MPSETLASLLTHLRQDDQVLPDYLDRLEGRFNELEPRIHAFVPEEGRFERLRREAGTLARRYPNPEERPPLYGLLVGVKDIFHVDGFVTRAGTTVPLDLFQGAEATAVTALKEAGALVLGKTFTTEFAYFAPGPTRHPLSDALGEDYTPGGSSSGSAAAVAAALCPLALGTQTIGSISRPAAFCGIVGFKPSFDRISTAGVLPLSPSADTVGLFVTQAADIAPVAAVMVTDWRAVPKPKAQPILGVPIGPYLDNMPVEMLDHFRTDCGRLVAAGYTIREIQVLSDFEGIYKRHNQLVAAEAADVHTNWYVAYGDRYHPKTAELIERGQSVSEDDYRTALASRQELREILHARMDETGIDLWLTPAALGPALRGLASTGDPVMNLPWTHAGLPTVALPSGNHVHGLPIGLQVAGRYSEDEELVAAAIRLGQSLA